jgi:hypothetical protein
VPHANSKIKARREEAEVTNGLNRNFGVFECPLDTANCFLVMHEDRIESNVPNLFIPIFQIKHIACLRLVQVNVVRVFLLNVAKRLDLPKPDVVILTTRRQIIYFTWQNKPWRCEAKVFYRI